jgi:phage gpG-like protein
MYNISLDLTALYQLEEQLNRAGRDEKGLLWNEITPIVGQMLDDIFTSQVDSDGTPWPPHAPATVAMYGEHPLLILTGAMFDDLMGSALIADRRSNTDISFGTDIEYAPTHQYGDPSRNIPRREFLYWRQDALDRISDVAEQYMMDVYFYDYQ